MTNYDLMSEIINENNMTTEQLLQEFTNWHGSSVIDDNFIEYLESEEYYIPR